MDTHNVDTLDETDGGQSCFCLNVIYCSLEGPEILRKCRLCNCEKNIKRGSSSVYAVYVYVRFYKDEMRRKIISY